MAGVAQGQRRAAGARRRGQALGALGLLALLAAGTVLGVVLWAIDGGPRAPDWARLREVLSGSELADADLIAAAAAAAWLVLGYLAFSVGLRLLLLLASRLSGGARWARTGLRLSHLITLPAVRRLVDGGVAGTLLAASWLPLPAQSAHAADPVAIVAMAPPPAAVVDGPQLRPQVAPAQAEVRFAAYTVAPGDSLWDIARRCYGDGSRFVELFEANRERVMAGGERFTDPRLIRPGWVLAVPLPGEHLSVRDDVASYRVRRGDHLWGIAERWLGDGFRWVEIWERNRGRDVDAGRRLTDPNRIYPGSLLELPVGAAPVEIAGTALPAAPVAGPEPVALLAPLPAVTPLETAVAPVGPIERPAPGAGSEHDGGWSWEWPALPRPLLATAAGFAVIGGTAIFVQRLARSGRLRLPGTGRAAHGGPGDAGRVTLATRSLARALADYGFEDSHPLLVREGGPGLEFTVACPAGDAEALLALRHDLERRLGCTVKAVLTGPTRVALTLSGPRRLADLPAAGPTAPPALVVPVGADTEGIVYLNLAAAGSVAVAGTAGERRALLRSWLATLATTCSANELSFRVDSQAAQLLDADTGLPHFAGTAGAGDAAELAEELDEIVQSRGAGGTMGHPLVAIFDLAETAGEPPAAAMRYGPAAAVFVICCLPPGEPADRLTTCGAAIAFGAAGDGADGDGDGAPPREIVLSIGREPPLLLEPVHVRRDTSARWSESAELATPAGPPGRASDDPLRPREAVESTAGDERPRHDDTRHHGADGAGAVLPHSIMPHDPLAGFAADGDRGENAATRASAGSDSAPEPDPSEPDDPAGERKSEAGSGPERVAIPLAQAEEQVVAEWNEATPPGEPAPDEAAVTLPEPEPGRPASLSRPPGAIRQAALLTHDDLSPPARGVASGAQTVFTVSCLGPFELRLGTTPVARWPLEKARELLAFLATQGGAAVPRESVAEAMWPDYPWDASLRHMIANAVSSLRSVVRSAAGDDALQPVVTARRRYQLQSALFRSDLDAFESALRRAAALPDADALAEYERATTLYHGDFLEGELFPWIDAYRSDYRQRLVDGANRAAAIARRLGERERAARLYQVILEQEPTDEAAARGRMRQLAAAGEVNGARKVFKALTEALQRELDDPRAGPAPETKALLAELLAGEQGGVA